MLIIMVTIAVEQTVPALAEVVVRATIAMLHGAALLVQVMVNTMLEALTIAKVGAMARTTVIMLLTVSTEMIVRAHVVVVDGLG